MAEPGALRDEARRLLTHMQRAGALRVETDILQPADVLLDLYGEDIRARAFTTLDPEAGELMLRPDFTVPVVRAHMEGGAEPARYAYAGKVFRAPDIAGGPGAGGRAREYWQVGYELFDGADVAAADAEVFALFHGLLAPLGLRPVTGDRGLLLAAVRGLDTTERRKAALLRHIWRPRRFRALLERFAGQAPPPEGRAELLAGKAGIEAPVIGLRTRAEIEARIAALIEDAAAPPIAAAELALMREILGLRESMANVARRLEDFAARMPALAPAVIRFEARMQALTARGIDPEKLLFEGSYGRTSMEYYDGFVFGFTMPGGADRPALPPVATGGRYDALTRVLGKGRAIPAVGGVVRPELVLEVRACA